MFAPCCQHGTITWINALANTPTRKHYVSDRSSDKINVNPGDAHAFQWKLPDLCLVWLSPLHVRHTIRLSDAYIGETCSACYLTACTCSSVTYSLAIQTLTFWYFAPSTFVLYSSFALGWKTFCPPLSILESLSYQRPQFQNNKKQRCLLCLLPLLFDPLAR